MTLPEDRTFFTLPRLPSTLPVSRITSSSRRNFAAIVRSLEYFWCQRDNFHELLITQFTSYRPKNTRADRLLAVIVSNNACITIEANDRTVRATNTLLGAHHYRLQHIAFLHLTARNCFLDGNFDDVTDACVATVRAT